MNEEVMGSYVLVGIDMCNIVINVIYVERWSIYLNFINFLLSIDKICGVCVINWYVGYWNYESMCIKKFIDCCLLFCIMLKFYWW